ncbi:hypothetical protein CRM22_004107 [Opisthorchis felineus]|uniref:Uncharacterized protein n=1 Tax=Opisthorchis felineus TaxID=147828 RepID=A0A4S2LXU1_OPIFE|nr:hypothetical protein CRM22_004107 [Opisthorchis felineus]
MFSVFAPLSSSVDVYALAKIMLCVLCVRGYLPFVGVHMFGISLTVVNGLFVYGFCLPQFCNCSRSEGYLVLRGMCLCVHLSFAALLVTLLCEFYYHCFGVILPLNAQVNVRGSHQDASLRRTECQTVSLFERLTCFISSNEMETELSSSSAWVDCVAAVKYFTSFHSTSCKFLCCLG